jgi:hypothetical protein
MKIYLMRNSYQLELFEALIYQIKMKRLRL